MPRNKYGAVKTRKAPVATERAEQTALFKWLTMAAPDGLFYSATAGGDGRATRTPGYRAGLPDVVLIWRGRPIWIELKRERGGAVSDAQWATNQAIVMAGGVTFIANGWVEAARWLVDIIPMRSSAP